jgi:tRNA threonylcarbamoyladenosine biosynthesis protein TsaE
MKIKTQSEKETKKVGKKIAEKIKKSKERVLALDGDLGAGKTTFTKGFAKEFGIEEITSPTFVIMKKYKLKNKEFDYLFHIDCYRLKNKDQLKQLNFKEIVKNKRNIILIEWPEKIEGALKNEISINFKFISKKEREIKIPDKLNLKINQNKL